MDNDEGNKMTFVWMRGKVVTRLISNLHYVEMTGKNKY